MLFPIHRAFLLVLPVLVACSGKVDVEQTSGGPGGGGQGGSGGAGGGGQGGSGSTTCPVDPPVNGAPCHLSADQECTYGACCPRLFSCTAGSWSEADVDCAPPNPCPSSPPLEGAPCKSGCAQESPCTYNCAQSDVLFTVTCGDDDRWHSGSASLCHVPLLCGDMLQCLEGYVCVTKQAFGSEYQCVPDPCGPDPLSCACAEPVCGDGFTCIQASEKNVLCECPACK
ncbi:hypothetical protein [Polyangium sp. 6x1]|uniref:hypothetical protein n=1 Tax=Polyangium sp. 6x1 TaxID=3042689 RepID=UPI002482B15F|nr:hypothetical protein [Polyangium sp. 6x1]MDI1450975.1 hypothetical protein [Polyangium sp. 6x1]